MISRKLIKVTRRAEKLKASSRKRSQVLREQSIANWFIHSVTVDTYLPTSPMALSSDCLHFVRSKVRRPLCNRLCNHMHLSTITTHLKITTLEHAPFPKYNRACETIAQLHENLQPRALAKCSLGDSWRNDEIFHPDPTLQS